MKIVVDSIKIIEKMKIFEKKENKIVSFILWDRQVDFLNFLHSEKNIIVLKKRQVGMSQLVGADSLAQCMLLPNFLTIVMSISAAESKEFLLRIKDMYDSLPIEFKKLFPMIPTSDKLIFTGNKSRIISIPASSGSSYTANRFIIDEAAKITKEKSRISLKEVDTNVAPTLEKAGGQLIYISTANGQNLFARKYWAAKNTNNSFKSFFFSCWDDPTFTKENRERLVIDYGEDYANQEYPRTDKEAFLSSGRPRFNLKILSDIKAKKELVRGEISDDGRILVNDKGPLRFFEKIDVLGGYMLFVDVAEGLEKGDYSCIKVFDRHSWNQVCEWHGHIDYSLLGKPCVILAKYFNNAIITIERNNHGVAPLTYLLHTAEYPEELIFQSYENESESDYLVNPVKRFGWATNKKTKLAMIDNLATMIQQQETKEFSEQDIEELTTYIYDSRGRTNAEEGCFDDRVITLAMAFYLLPDYAYNKPAEWKRCVSCAFFIYNEETKSRHCTKTKKVCKEDSCCDLFVDDINSLYHKIEKENNLLKRNKKITRRLI